MGRQKLIKYKDGAYHVNAKTNNGDWFPIPLQDCWNIFSFYLNEMSVRFNIRVHAFTLMSNHFHLLCSTPGENLDVAMRYFMQMTSKGINLAANRKNHLWGGKYFWIHVDDPIGYAIVYKYIFRNPLRANLCESIADYPWTSISKNKLQIFKNEMDIYVPYDQLIEWINSSPEDFDESVIKNAFRKTKLKPSELKKGERKQEAMLTRYLTQYGREKPRDHFIFGGGEGREGDCSG